MLDKISSDRIPLGTLIQQLDREARILELSSLQEFSSDMKFSSDERRAWRALQIEKLKQTALHTHESKGWSLFTDIVQYMGGAFSLITGAALVGTGAGAVAGSALIITGALTINSKVCQETGVTRLIAERATAGDPVKTEKLLAQIDLGLTISSIVLNMATVLISTAYITSTAIKALMGSFKGFSIGAEGVAGIGHSKSQSKQIKASAEASFLQTQIGKSNRQIKHFKKRSEAALSSQDQSLVEINLESRAKRIDILFENNPVGQGG